MRVERFKQLVKHCIRELLTEEFLKDGKRICAWCGKSLGEDPNIPGTSHGICPTCLEKEKDSLKNDVTLKKIQSGSDVGDKN